jgi:SAM-dependent methyltransferase
MNRTTGVDYGLDAPGVVRNLMVAAVVGLCVFLSSALGLWSGVVSPTENVGVDLRFTSLAVGVTCGLMAAWMVWSSKFGKRAEREKLLDQIRWTGTEQVLDAGCGRGLMLIGAAKRLTTGKAVGIDIWQAEDLSRNRPEATLNNARLEGVAERVRVETADMRKLPFPDATFNVIVSKAAIHNIYEPSQRAEALAELSRVLAPGGQILIDDIRNLSQYEAELRARKMEVRRIGNPAVALGLAIVTWGSLRPGALLARKT